MVNAGAIACSGLIHAVEGAGAFERVRDALGRFAGRELGVDEAVFQSERSTGDRNRAIGYMLRNYSVVEGNVDEVLDVYFRQCSILVTARDLAVMAATLANRGINPISKQQVVSPYAVARTLSVMTSSGMYDYAGEWVYRVGIPAKSGVGGGIIAALPGQIGLGTFSPLLDSHGNSVRGIKVCETLSSHFELHVLNRSNDVRTSVIADYDIKGISSRRSRQPHEQAILDDHYQDIRVIELVGALAFANTDYVSRRLAERTRPALFIIDLRRVPAVTEGAARLIADMVRDLATLNVTMVFSGTEKSSPVWKTISAATSAVGDVRRFRSDRRGDRVGGRPGDLPLRRLLGQPGFLAARQPGFARRLERQGTRRFGRARQAAQLSHRRTHRDGRRSGDLDLLPAERHGQRQAA